MDYAKKLSRLDEHLKEHPRDYQAVIGRIKMQSDAYEHELYKRKIGRLQRLSKVRKMRKEGKYGGES